MISLDRLRAFAGFADHLNFTRAAEQLHISQPALHVQIKKLAAELGVSLYTKKGRELVLTPDGEATAAFAREILDRTTSFCAEIRGAESTQPLTLAAGEGTYLYLLGDAIRRFTKKKLAPLRLLTADRERAVDLVATGRAHVAVTVGAAQTAGVRSQRLTTIGQVIAMPRQHALAERQVIRPRDLAGQALIVPPADRDHRRAVEDALRVAGASWEVAVEANGWELMLHFVRLGLGLAIVNSFCSPPPGVVMRPFQGLAKRDYFIHVRRGFDRPALTFLIDCLRA